MISGWPRTPAACSLDSSLLLSHIDRSLDRIGAARPKLEPPFIEHRTPPRIRTGFTLQSHTPQREGATHALHGCPRQRHPGSTVSRRMPAQKETEMQLVTMKIDKPESTNF